MSWLDRIPDPDLAARIEAAADPASSALALWRNASPTALPRALAEPGAHARMAMQVRRLQAAARAAVLLAMREDPGVDGLAPPLARRQTGADFDLLATAIALHAFGGMGDAALLVDRLRRQRGLDPLCWQAAATVRRG